MPEPMPEPLPADSPRPLIAFGLVVVALIAVWGALTFFNTPPAATFVREEPCPESRFTCITLRVPQNHFGGGSATFEVTFGLLTTTESPAKGVIVMVTGGPGTSGLSVADSYTDYFDPGVPEQYDIVFLDQRGIGLSEPLQCPNASLVWYSTQALPTASASDAEAYADAASQYVTDCLDETGVDPSSLAYFSTRQAVEDLEAFLDWLEADQIDLYGESYGTQYAQVYAAAHPDRIHALLIDGPVDLTLSGTDYYAEDVRALDETLSMTLDLCTQDSGCSADVVGGDALAAYDLLAAELQAGPREYDFVTASGDVERRTFSVVDLETAAAYALSPTYDRMLLQRAMAQASRGELLPLARLLYPALGQNQETLAAVPDPTWSDAMYYAVECMDYAFGSGTASERAAAYLAAGEAAEVARYRLGSGFYLDLPCAYWPVYPDSEERPAYLRDTPYPVFVLASTTDPYTPYPNAERIFDQLNDAYLIVQPGGPHIIYLRGEPCPDDLIHAYLVSGELPAERSTTCEFLGVDPYVPIPAAKVADYDSDLAALSAVDDEINNAADYWNWNGVDPLTSGCLRGGSITYAATDVGYEVTLTNCAYIEGLALSGTGSILDDGSFGLSVTTEDGIQLSYARDPDGERTVTGTLGP